MRLVECNDRLYGCKWECRRQVKGKRHKVELSIHKRSWFEGSDLTLEEILKLTYWWCRDVAQETMRFEAETRLWIGIVFVGRIYEVSECEEKMGGPGKCVQMDESKFGK